MWKRIPSVAVCSLCLVGSLFSQTISSSPHGINVHLVEDEVLEKVVEAGISWIRIDIHWYETEPAEGVIDYTRVDRVVAFAETRGLSILAVLAYTPGWANGGLGLNHPPEDGSAWTRFVTRTVTRYKNRIKYWNIWNEPNMDVFWAGGKDTFVDEIFLPAAWAIRTADPAAFIVGPELAHLTSEGQEWYFWMKYILERCGDTIDIVSHHIYESAGVGTVYQMLEEGEFSNGVIVPSVKGLVKEVGQTDKPFWITETGWETDTFSEQTQADRYLEMLQTMKTRMFPNRIFFYEIIDDPAPAIPAWGILRSDLGEKMAYTVYRDFIAGEYGDPEEDPEEENDCWAEEMLSGTDGGRLDLARLRVLRSRILGIRGLGQALVSLYRRLSPGLTRRCLADSRWFRLSRAVLSRLARGGASPMGPLSGTLADLSNRARVTPWAAASTRGR